MKPIFQLSGNSRVMSVNAFEVGTGLLVAGGIRDDGFTGGEIGERESPGYQPISFKNACYCHTHDY